jgi:hypothetical protein
MACATIPRSPFKRLRREKHAAFLPFSCSMIWLRYDPRFLCWYVSPESSSILQWYLRLAPHLLALAASQKHLHWEGSSFWQTEALGFAVPNSLRQKFSIITQGEGTSRVFFHNLSF